MNNNNNNNNNFIYIALISWAHGALQCKKGENEIIYISQARNKKKKTEHEIKSSSQKLYLHAVQLQQIYK